jgi:hypothetical protein
MKRILLLGTVLACGSGAEAAVFSYSGLPFDITDGSGVGVGATIDVSGLTGPITDINVSLKIEGSAAAGGFTGDLYSFLSYGGQKSVLLNRPGKTAPDTDLSAGFTALLGYSDNGLNVKFDDEAASEIHGYNGALPSFDGDGLLLGSWQPDARDIDPSLVTPGTPRTSLLSAFDGLNPNGTWNFFFADLESGGLHRVTAINLDITTASVTPVPELGSGVVLFGLVSGITILRRKTCVRQKG